MWCVYNRLTHNEMRLKILVQKDPEIKTTKLISRFFDSWSIGLFIALGKIQFDLKKLL